MIDLNHICLFLALVSPLAVLVRSWRSSAAHEGWRLAAIVVLGVTAVSWVLIRNEAGYIGAGAWFALLFLPAVGLKRVAELAAYRQYRSARRLASLLRWLHPTADLRGQVETFRYLEIKQQAGDLPAASASLKASRRERRRLRGAPAVGSFIAINILVFGVESLTTAIKRYDIFLEVGKLQPLLVFLAHQYWRLVTALFLHAGLVHLLFNLFALYVLGPPFERAIGSLRFIACYLLSGICSTAGVMMLWRVGVLDDAHATMVGASGCVMGIVGGWAAYLIRDHQAPLARRRLTNIVMIVLIQTAFDLTTREVSMSAHLCGLVGGFLVGLVVTPRSRAKGNLEHHAATSA